MMIKTALSLALLLFFASCAKKEGTSSATMEISRGFAITNPSFGGGLIITGKSDRGQEFSLSVSSGTTLNLVLAKATWVVKAVGWDGGTPEKMFGGTPYCGIAVKSLVNDDEVIDLVVRKDKCADPIFTAGNANFVDSSVTPATFRRLGNVNTCGTFFFTPSVDLVIKPSNKVFDTLVSNSTLDNACANDKVPLDLKSQVRSIRILSLEKGPADLEMRPGIDTGCIMATGAVPTIDLQGSFSSYNGHDIRLPFSGVPFMIQTFADDSCNKFVADYRFRRGLADSYPKDFDHILLPGTAATGVKLWLPGNESRRAKSPFLASMPFFNRYDAGFAKRFETVPSSASPADVSIAPEFHGTIGINKILLPEKDCAKPITVTAPLKSPTCTNLGGMVEIIYTADAEGQGTLTNMRSTPYRIYISAAANTKRYLSQNAVVDLLGHSNPLLPNTFYSGRSKVLPEVQIHGALSLARHFLGPKGAGVFSINDSDIIANKNKTFSELCEGLVGKQEKLIFNPTTMTMETWLYEISGSAPVSSPTAFTCENTSVDDSCVAAGNYNKRMKIYNYAYSTVAPVAAFEFDCSGYIGRMEVSAPALEFNRRTKVREIIHWNSYFGATGDSPQRFERLTLDTTEELVAGKWILKEMKKSMARVFKENTTNWTGKVYNYNAREESGSWNQRIDSFGLETIGTVLYLKHDAMIDSNVDPMSVFTKATLGGSPVIVGSLPPATSSDTNYNLVGNWPATIAATSYSFTSHSFTNGGDKIDGNLPMQLDSMALDDFKVKFESEFLTGP